MGGEIEKHKNRIPGAGSMDGSESRFIAKGSDGQEYAVALKRHSQIENGDILEYDPERKVAIVIRIALKPVLVVELKKIAAKTPEEIIRRCVELGHAVGNQHWPAIVKGTKLYIPLTVDKKVMTSVMDTHHFEDITYEFQTGLEVIPFLAPHEIRQLFGGSSQEITHHHDAVHGTIIHTITNIPTGMNTGRYIHDYYTNYRNLNPENIT